jgi:hypothetical protein
MDAHVWFFPKVLEGLLFQKKDPEAAGREVEVCRGVYPGRAVWYSDIVVTARRMPCSNARCSRYGDLRSEREMEVMRDTGMVMSLFHVMARLGQPSTCSGRNESGQSIFYCMNKRCLFYTVPLFKGANDDTGYSR